MEDERKTKKSVNRKKESMGFGPNLGSGLREGGGDRNEKERIKVC